MVNIREYLNKIKGIDLKINMYKNEVIRLKKEIDGLSAIDYSKPPIQTSTRHDILDRIVELEDAIEKLEKTRNERKIVFKKIECIDDNRLKSLLYNRYIQGKKWDEVASEMGYVSEYVQRKLHPKALKEFKKIFSHKKS